MFCEQRAQSATSNKQIRVPFPDEQNESKIIRANPTACQSKEIRQASQLKNTSSPAAKIPNSAFPSLWCQRLDSICSLCYVRGLACVSVRMSACVWPNMCARACMRWPIVCLTALAGREIIHILSQAPRGSSVSEGPATCAWSDSVVWKSSGRASEQNIIQPAQHCQSVPFLWGWSKGDREPCNLVIEQYHLCSP